MKKKTHVTSSKNIKKTLWGSAFTDLPTEAVLQFTSGKDVTSTPPADLALLPYDVWGSQAHCVMLYAQKIIDLKDAQVILKGLKEIEQLIQTDHFILDPKKEDVHTNVETWLVEKYGIEHAGKLHTARSRNDQCALDTRLYLRDQLLLCIEESMQLVEVLLGVAHEHQDTIMPGFTHHQHAMVTTFGHVVLGFASMVVRDVQRLTQWCVLHNLNPLGSAAGYGTSFPIDAQLTTSYLGFDEPTYNAMDVVNNRWEAESELGFGLMVFMNHLSTVAQTLILFATPEFGMIQLADAYSTGSSIMPQKKNPDTLEVMKGKANVMNGLLVGLLNFGRGSFIGYNRETQWTKYLILQIVDEFMNAPLILKGCLETLTVHKEKMAAWCEVGFISTTTLLEQIASQYHLPFRQAKILVEKAIKYSVGKHQVTFTALQKAAQEEGLELAMTPAQLTAWQDPSVAVELTQSAGGPGKKAIAQSISRLNEHVTDQKKWLLHHRKKIAEAKDNLAQAIASILKQ